MMVMIPITNWIGIAESAVTEMLGKLMECTIPTSEGKEVAERSDVCRLFGLFLRAVSHLSPSASFIHYRSLSLSISLII